MGGHWVSLRFRNRMRMEGNSLLLATFLVDLEVVFMTVEYNISLAARKRGTTVTCRDIWARSVDTLPVKKLCLVVTPAFLIHVLKHK
jgi:hypothetical protein